MAISMTHCFLSVSVSIAIPVNWFSFTGLFKCPVQLIIREIGATALKHRYILPCTLNWETFFSGRFCPCKLHQPTASNLCLACGCVSDDWFPCRMYLFLFYLFYFYFFYYFATETWLNQIKIQEHPITFILLFPIFLHLSKLLVLLSCSLFHWLEINFFLTNFVLVYIVVWVLL